MLNVKEAVVARFQELLKARGMSVNELATLSGVTPSSVYSMLDPRRKELTINLIKSCATGWRFPWASFSPPSCSIRWSRKYVNVFVR